MKTRTLCIVAASLCMAPLAAIANSAEAWAAYQAGRDINAEVLQVLAIFVGVFVLLLVARAVERMSGKRAQKHPPAKKQPKGPASSGAARRPRPAGRTRQRNVRRPPARGPH